MPRRGRASSPMSRSSPSRSLPARQPQTAPAAVQSAAPRQPGMMAQMATTAAGVAVGSAVGHTIGHVITGGMGGRSEAAAPPQDVGGQTQQQQQQQPNPCQMEFQSFVDCAQNQHDISLCRGFNEALKQCKLQYGL